MEEPMSISTPAPQVPAFEPAPVPVDFVAPPKHWWSPGQPWREQRWGPFEVVLTVPALIATTGLIFALTAVIPDDGIDTIVTLALGALVWFAMPLYAVKRRGSGSLADDLGLRFRAADIGLGIGGFFAAMITVALFMFTAMALTGQEETVSNTGFIGDVSDQPWTAFVVAGLVAIVVPIGEELFFRGLVLRALTKRWNIVAGSIVSWIVFGLGHFQPGTLGEVATLYAGIFALAIVMTAQTILTGRLGPSIVTHVLINTAATAVALFGPPSVGGVIVGF